MLKNSAAMLYLQELKLKKALGRFHAENLSKGAYTYSYTQQVSTGAKLPSMGYIISLRHMIPPALWFYTDDSKPKDVSFSESVIEDPRLSKNFEVLKSSRLSEWYTSHGIPYITTYSLVSGKRSLTPSRIAEWANIFPPELWFR